MYTSPLQTLSRSSVCLFPLFNYTCSQEEGVRRERVSGERERGRIYGERKGEDYIGCNERPITLLQFIQKEREGGIQVPLATSAYQPITDKLHYYFHLLGAVPETEKLREGVLN